MTEVSGCRVCGGELEPVLNLGVQPLSSVFPPPGNHVQETPLELMSCKSCGLVQLRHDCPTEVWGETYGYRSGLNKSMVNHLYEISRYAVMIAGVKPGDLILDIGSNDGTLLGHYGEFVARVGFDPTARKFREHYREGIVAIDKFFSAEAFQAMFRSKAQVVTSIAMFYDLAAPLEFACDVREILDDEGIWISEQSYLPAMVRARSFDTICHEHLEYYMLVDIVGICAMTGLRVIDVSFDDTNGGSFRVTIAHAGSSHQVSDRVSQALAWELHWRKCGSLERFAAWVPGFRDRLEGIFDVLHPSMVWGYGASTKGNILLNYCGLGPTRIEAIADVNPDKWGKVTPGSNIPIISEDEAKAQMVMDWDGYVPHAAPIFMVLPWHFRDAIVKREAKWIREGGFMWFPLPEHEFV